MSKKKKKRDSNLSETVKEQVAQELPPEALSIQLKIILFVLSLGVCYLVFYHHERSIKVGYSELPPLNKTLPQEFYSQIKMDGSLLELVRSYEDYYLKKDYTKALTYGWKMVDKYGFHCHPCVAMVLDAGIKLRVNSDPKIQNLCKQAVEAMGPIPRMLAACSYFDKDYETKLKYMGMNISEAWKYAYSFN